MGKGGVRQINRNSPTDQGNQLGLEIKSPKQIRGSASDTSLGGRRGEQICFVEKMGGSSYFMVRVYTLVGHTLFGGNKYYKLYVKL